MFSKLLKSLVCNYQYPKTASKFPQSSHNFPNPSTNDTTANNHGSSSLFCQTKPIPRSNSLQNGFNKGKEKPRRNRNRKIFDRARARTQPPVPVPVVISRESYIASRDLCALGFRGLWIFDACTQFDPIFLAVSRERARLWCALSPSLWIQFRFTRAPENLMDACQLCWLFSSLPLARVLICASGCFFTFEMWVAVWGSGCVIRSCERALRLLIRRFPWCSFEERINLMHFILRLSSNTGYYQFQFGPMRCIIIYWV